MEVSGHLRTQAALPQKKNPVPIRRKAGWVPEPVWTLWRGEKPLAPDKNRILAVQPVACRYIDWAIPAVPDMYVCIGERKWMAGLNPSGPQESGHASQTAAVAASPYKPVCGGTSSIRCNHS
jgi:hypothetical protein